MVGIGVEVRDESNVVSEVWAMKERSTGNFLVDYANAVRLSLAKAWLKQWTKIKVMLLSQKLIKGIHAAKAKDIRLATLLEDIGNIKAMFQSCSFGFTSSRIGSLSETCLFAMNACFDEEIVFPRRVSPSLV